MGYLLKQVFKWDPVLRCHRHMYVDIGPGKAEPRGTSMVARSGLRGGTFTGRKNSAKGAT